MWAVSHRSLGLAQTCISIASSVPAGSFETLMLTYFIVFFFWALHGTFPVALTTDALSSLFIFWSVIQSLKNSPNESVGPKKVIHTKS